ncbi:MAG: ArsR/SmtB family transcription factor [Dehalococcoidia bacterium]
MPRTVELEQRLDQSFSALSDGTRRGVLRRLGRGDATISDLASMFDMTLTGMKKHVTTLEASGLVKTRKEGRVRVCSLGSQKLDAETAWIAAYREVLVARLDRLESFLDAMSEEVE